MTGQSPLIPAFVLHRRPYRDTSLLLELFTLDVGRLPLVARGAAAARSRRRGLLQPFIPLLVGWRGRGEVATLTRVEAAGPAPALQGRALFSALYFNELLMRLLPRGEGYTLLFERYRAALQGLAQGAALEPLLRRFELDLLAELGYAPELRRDVSGAPIEAQRWYHCRPGLAPRPLEHSRDDAVRGETLLALAAGVPLEGEATREARRLLRSLLAPHLGGRPLKSRELFRTMTASTPSSES